MTKDEVNLLVIQAGFNGENIDEIVNACFEEL